MAGVVKKSVLAAKLGAKANQAIAKHRNDEPVIPTGGRLPDGIENGIAQLVECKVDTYKDGANKGQPFFYAAGIVVSPEDHNGAPIKGLRTSIIEPLHDTPSRKRATFDDHIQWCMNQLRILGYDTSSMTTGDDFEGACEAIKEAQPYFRFRTWKGSKQTTGPYAGKEPRVNEDWMGQVQYDSTDTAVDAGVNDATADETTHEEVVDDATEPSNDETQGEADAGGVDESALEALVARAAKDKKAQKELNQMALDAGVDQDTIDNADDWAAVADLIRGAGETAAEPEAAGDEPATPEVGDVWFFTPKDPKTGKPLTDPKTKKIKRLEVEIVTVNGKKQTATVKDLNTGKPVPGEVKWSDLDAQ